MAAPSRLAIAASVAAKFARLRFQSRQMACSTSAGWGGPMRPHRQRRAWPASPHGPGACSLRPHTRAAHSAHHIMVSHPTPHGTAWQLAPTRQQRKLAHQPQSRSAWQPSWTSWTWERPGRAPLELAAPAALARTSVRRRVGFAAGQRLLLVHTAAPAGDGGWLLSGPVGAAPVPTACLRLARCLVCGPVALRPTPRTKTRAARCVPAPLCKLQYITIYVNLHQQLDLHQHDCLG
jgi:hypothetical protein